MAAAKPSPGHATQNRDERTITKFRDVVDYIRFHPLEEQNNWEGLTPVLEQFAEDADRQRKAAFHSNSEREGGSMDRAMQEDMRDEAPPDELIVVVELLRNEGVLKKRKLLRGILRAIKISLRNPRNRKYLREETIETLSNVLHVQHVPTSCVIEVCNCILNMCHYQANIDVLLEKEDTLRQLLTFFTNANTYSEDTRLLKSASIGSLQSLCYYAQGRLFLRRMLHRQTSEAGFQENQFFELIKEALYPIPFSAEDQLFSKCERLKYRKSPRDTESHKRQLGKETGEVKQLLQRCLGCLLNISSDPELGEHISSTDVSCHSCPSPLLLPTFVITQLCRIQGLIETIGKFLDVPLPELVKPSLNIIQNLARSGPCRRQLQNDQLLDRLCTLSMSGNAPYQISATAALLNLLAPYSEDSIVHDTVTHNDSKQSLSDVDEERVAMLRQIRENVRGALSDNFAAGMILRQLTIDGSIPLSSLD
eukprot:gb/GECG01009958.1/.p1 GENE.gb/GECG01009958.1/~~gb/GECG01009958.1/.p1  ORF type:complete len:479 (+),score=47.16 gb/GECG01009958.1/:1-1437(+)